MSLQQRPRRRVPVPELTAVRFAGAFYRPILAYTRGAGPDSASGLARAGVLL
jgi:hypothetical protein